MKVIVTIPAYNEARSIGPVITNIKKVMVNYKYEILVVDDGSRDDTAQAAKKAGAIVYSHPRNMGLAETFRTEINKCLELKADVIIHIDADGQYLASEIPKLVSEIKNGYDLVLGSRFKGKIEYMPLIKKMGNKMFSRIVSQITRMKISDAQTGFRAFTRKLAEEIPITTTYTYTQEQIIRTAKNKFRIKEVPVYFAKRHGKSRLMKNAFDYAIKSGINVLRLYRDYQPLKFFGFFGILFFGSGFLIGLWLLYLFLTTGEVGHLPLTMASVLLMVIGIQIGLFAFFADMNRK